MGFIGKIPAGMGEVVRGEESDHLFSSRDSSPDNPARVFEKDTNQSVLSEFWPVKSFNFFTVTIFSDDFFHHEGILIYFMILLKNELLGSSKQSSGCSLQPQLFVIRNLQITNIGSPDSAGHRLHYLMRYVIFADHWKHLDHQKLSF